MPDTPAFPPTPSQTVGPFYGYALPFPGGGDVAPAGHPDAVTLHGVVYDGAGAPVPDALLEFWQGGPGTGEPGSMRRSPVNGGFLGRDGVRFTGFGRVATDADGHYALRTLPPRTPAPLPYLSVCVFARGLMHHLYTRAYLADGDDALLGSLEPARRATLVAVREENPARHRAYRFDIRLQGEGETVFLEFH
ncbi:protocatechuate 3,4-dioxygenase subunit alpha [Streptomyces sp. NRRL F-5126]|uniref:protocatechuate 3,4-dioxygenase subunit alpha n=1 Tax=Streptomyces sp. NRRL F-5126 TaxID=1463857 RepID=UPI0004C94C76|nr:protocatechuate 3,4-dioxygenase subunit alpha [Streptomyces sp. NRRL F-5126]